MLLTLACFARKICIGCLTQNASAKNAGQTMRTPHNPNSRAQIAREIDSLSKDAAHWARRVELSAAGRSLADSNATLLDAAKIAKQAASMLQTVAEVLLSQGENNATAIDETSQTTPQRNTPNSDS